MTIGLLDYFAQKAPAIAAEQLKLEVAIRKRLNLARGRKGSGRVPDPFLFHLVHQQPRPSREAWNQWVVDATSAPGYSAQVENGLIEMPFLGQFHVTSRTKRALVDLSDRRGPVCSDRSATLHPYQWVAHHFAVPRFIPSAFRPFFGGRQGVRSASPDGVARLQAALQMARQVGALTWIRQVVRLVVLFRGGALNSFYNPRAHGAIFIRINRACDEYHVFEEIIHQAGHAFFAILLCREPHLIRNQNCTLTAAFDGSEDGRNVLVALHGLVTEALIAEALFRLRASPGVAEQDLLGRLAFCLAKFGSDLNAATRAKRLLTKRGLLWLSTMARSYASTVRELGPRLSRLDLSGQPYLFDQHVFIRKNRCLAGTLSPMATGHLCKGWRSAGMSTRLMNQPRWMRERKRR